MFEATQSSLAQVFPRIAEMRETKNPAGLLGVLRSMTEEGLLRWTVVLGTSLTKITAVDVAGVLSITLTRTSNEFRSPIEIELHHLSGVVAADSRCEKFVIDPGNFTSFSATIWQRASAIFTELRQSAVQALTAGTKRPSAD